MDNNFQEFFERWVAEQDRHLQHLISAAGGGGGGRREEVIGRVMEHYEHYYRVKSECAKRDPVGMLTPAWLSSLEDAFLWIGGWRPTTAFHLLYSKSGLQLEARLSNVAAEEEQDLGDLSLGQMVRVDQLQKRTVAEERSISEKMAKHQESLADSSMVHLSHLVSRTQSPGDVEFTKERVDAALAPKEQGLVALLERADGLRLRTLKAIVGQLLTPIQAVHFLIAAAELHLRIHDWGKTREAAHATLPPPPSHPPP